MTSLYRLSLPIVKTEDDSFTRDLLHQFDKRRSRLHFELGLLSKEPSPEPSMMHDEPIPLDQDIEEEESSNNNMPSFSNHSKRSSTASDLFRRSSVFLKSKLNLLRKNKSLPPENIDHQKKLLMKTTISIPSTNNINAHQQDLPTSIPIITQYPPKPLVYSPIEPIPQDQKPLLHRLSMPLMPMSSPISLSRNKSMASFRRKQQQRK